MKRLCLFLFLFSPVWFTAPIAGAGENEASVFVLVDQDGRFDIIEEVLSTGSTLQYNLQEHPEVIDILLPVGPGGSGEIIQRGQRTQVGVVFDGTSLTKFAVLAGNSVAGSPPRPVEDIKRHDSHVSVVGGDGRSAAFLLTAYSAVMTDTVGPVQDMFRGMVPLEPGDYSLFLNTESNSGRQSVTGEIAADYSGKYLFVEAIGPNGKKGLFAVDIAASVNIIEKAFLPGESDISDKYMIEYSSKGQRQLKYSPGGATGPVESIIGSATLDDFRIGELTFEDVSFDVMGELPTLHGRDIDGIVGIDVLRGGRFLTIEYHAGEPNAARIVISNSPLKNASATVVPFVTIGKLIYVRGRANDIPVSFILDSGSPDCSISPAMARQMGIDLSGSETIEYAGAGGQKEEGRIGVIPTLYLGSREFVDVPFVFGETFVLSMLAKGQYGGLIGNSLLSQFTSVSFDFQEGLVSFAL